MLLFYKKVARPEGKIVVSRVELREGNEKTEGGEQQQGNHAKQRKLITV